MRNLWEARKLTILRCSNEFHIPRVLIFLDLLKLPNIIIVFLRVIVCCLNIRYFKRLTVAELLAIVLFELLLDKWLRLFVEGRLILGLLWHFFFDLGSLDGSIGFNRLCFGLVEKCGLALEIDILGTVCPSGAIHALIRPLHKNDWLNQ